MNDDTTLSAQITSLRGVRTQFTGNTRLMISELIADLVDLRQAVTVIGKFVKHYKPDKFLNGSVSFQILVV